MSKLFTKQQIIKIKNEYKEISKLKLNLKKSYKSVFETYKSLLKNNNVNDSKLLKNPFNKNLYKTTKNMNSDIRNEINYRVYFLKNLKEMIKDNDEILKNNEFNIYRKELNKAKRRLRNIKKVGVHIPENNINLIDYVEDEKDNVLQVAEIKESMKGKVKYIKLENMYHLKKIQPYELINNNMKLLVDTVIDETKEMNNFRMAVICNVLFEPNQNRKIEEKVNLSKYIRSK